MSVKQLELHADGHVVVIQSPDEVRADESFEVKVAVDEEREFSNTAKHHIRWIWLQFVPDRTKELLNVGHFSYCSDANPIDEPDGDPACTSPVVVVQMKVRQSGTIHALVLCSVHGMREATKHVRLIR